MQVSVETVSNIERRITVGIPAERVDAEVDKRLQRAAQTARINGFRAGKVPLKVIRQKYGKGIRQEVLGEVIQNSFYEAVTQEKLNPISPPTVETKIAEPGKALEYTATFEVYPDVKLGELDSLKIEKVVAEVTEADIDKMVEQLQTQRTEYEAVDRAAQNQDQADIDFSGTIDGETFKGGTAQGYKLVLGSNTMIPGFEAGMLGLKPGEEKTIQLQFPEQYHAKEIAGKKVDFAIKLNSLAEPRLPELNEDFFKSFGVEEGGVETFRAEVRKNMEKELKRALEAKLKTEIVDALLEVNQVDLPKSMVREEINRLRQEMAQRFGGGQQFDASSLPLELFQAQAEKRVATGLLMNRFVQEHNLKLDESRLEAYLKDFADSYDQPEEVVSYIRGDEQQLEHFRSLVLEQQIIEAIASKVALVEAKKSYEEAIKPQAEGDAGAVEGSA